MQAQMSKSKRRKQRLIERGIKLGEGVQTNAVVPYQPAQQIQKVSPQSGPRTSRNARRRLNRRRSNRIATGTANPSNYLYSLMYPENSIGAKVPDLVSYPSSTFQSEYSFSLTTGATSGNTVAVQVNPVQTDGTSFYPIITYNNTSANGVSTVAASYNWPSYGSIISGFKFVRLVSMSLSVYFIGASTADGGIACGGCTMVDPSATMPFTYDGWAALPEMAEFPVRQGMRIVWKPLDNTSLEYEECGMTLTEYTSRGHFLPRLVYCATGLPVSSTVVRCHITANWEGIPTSDQWDLLSPTHSPYDESTLKKAFEWGARIGNNIETILGAVGGSASALEQTFSTARRYLADVPRLRLGMSRQTNSQQAVRLNLGGQEKKSGVEDFEVAKSNNNLNLPSSTTIQINPSDQVERLEEELSRLRLATGLSRAPSSSPLVGPRN